MKSYVFPNVDLAEHRDVDYVDEYSDTSRPLWQVHDFDGYYANIEDQDFDTIVYDDSGTSYEFVKEEKKPSEMLAEKAE